MHNEDLTLAPSHSMQREATNAYKLKGRESVLTEPCTDQSEELDADTGRQTEWQSSSQRCCCEVSSCIVLAEQSVNEKGHTISADKRINNEKVDEALGRSAVCDHGRGASPLL